ncbi:hypothetical protein BUALT_BualtUnG0055100 [Buddleja alternifolia]|uniref:Uncharacterized protein n=1 Tax=Buddleja alternifolia TaxID=168488 RepID=A0AAV6W2Y1_9LAMI|nr:hypothetical protein BUALT_BualtUnG0055100 [Buddleja alternifolia]
MLLSPPPKLAETLQFLAVRQQRNVVLPAEVAKLLPKNRLLSEEWKRIGVDDLLWKKLLGPYAWVKCVPGEPILPNQPNEGSKQRRNEKKRIKQHPHL